MSAGIVNNWKKVEIKKSNDTNITWHTLYSTILSSSGYISSNAFLLNIANSLSTYDVKDAIELYINGTTLPTIGSNNNVGQADFSSAIKGIPFVGKKADRLLDVGTAAAGATLLASEFLDNDRESSNFSNYYPWAFNVPVFQSANASTINISLTFEFKLGQYGLWDAKEEVFNPIINLITPAMIRNIGNFSYNPPFGTIRDLWIDSIMKLFTDAKKGLETAVSGIVNGNSEEGQSESEESNSDSALQNIVDKGVNAVKNAGTKIINGEGEQVFEDAVNGVANAAKSIISISDDALNTIFGQINTTILAAEKQCSYTIIIGSDGTTKRHIYNNMIMTNATGTVSSDTDQNGYPISGSVTLTFQGVIPIALSSSISNNEIGLQLYQ